MNEQERKWTSQTLYSPNVASYCPKRSKNARENGIRNRKNRNKNRTYVNYNHFGNVVEIRTNSDTEKVANNDNVCSGHLVRTCKLENIHPSKKQTNRKQAGVIELAKNQLSIHHCMVARSNFRINLLYDTHRSWACVPSETKCRIVDVSRNK